MSCFVGGQKQACFSSWETSLVLRCLFCFHCLDARDSCLNISRCVVSFGLSGLWWTSHTLEVAIIALV